LKVGYRKDNSEESGGVAPPQDVLEKAIKKQKVNVGAIGSLIKNMR
jgi:hypothetical protein